MELKHYGVPGMKWYVRRYQNPDGTLTAAGRKRYLESKSSNAERQKFADEERRKIALRTKGLNQHEDGDYTIQKGTTVGRMTSKKFAEPIDSRQKYVYATKEDRDIYKWYSDNGYLGSKEQMHESVYEARKDVKVASAKKVKDYILEKWGNVKVKDLKNVKEYTQRLDPDVMRSLMNLTIKQIQKDLGSDEPDIPSESATNARKYFFTLQAAGRDIVQAFAHEKIFSMPANQLTMKDHFVKRGYDAVIDLEDFIGGSGFIPIILLNPSESVKYTTKEFGG